MRDPVFILSPPRSFTSVISAMIGQHPELYGLPEVNLFAADTMGGLLRWFRVRPRLAHGLLRAVSELGLGSQTVANITTAEEWAREDPDLPTSELFRDLGAWAGGSGLVDKSPLHVYQEHAMERMLESFPQARFIHLIRHPRSTCESVSKLQQSIRDGGGHTLTKQLDPDQVWLRPHKRIDEFLGGIPKHQYLLIRGEEFLSDPDTHLAELCSWLDIAADDYAIDAMKHPERSPFACLGPRNAPFGTDPGFIRDPKLRKFVAKQANLTDPVAMPGNPTFSDELVEYATRFGYE
jgi:hypothetical protein